MRRRLNGEDVGAFIISENIERLRLTKGQSAMAMIYPEPKRGVHSELTASGFDKANLSANRAPPPTEAHASSIAR
jgi:hypothetical protein